jgi:opacity protein-like surface antigen
MHTAITLFRDRRFARKAAGAFLSGSSLLLLVSPAFADCAPSQQLGTLNINNAQFFAIPTSAVASTLSSAIGNVNSIFLSQQGAAFVSAPANPAPDQPGGGVWTRAVGGEATVKSSSNSLAVGQPANPALGTAITATSCTNSVHTSFAGAQVGADVARLNWGGWNVHLGTLAGYLGSKSNDDFNFNNTIQVPYFGTYLVATKGRFFSDLLIRQEYYNINLNNPGFTYFNQPVGAHGYSVSASAGYNADLGQGWFAEPSAGFVYSRTSVDSFTAPGVAALSIPSTIATRDIESELGRLTLRFGRNIETPTVLWQPFASVNVFHEFAGNVVTSLNSLPNGAFTFPNNAPPAVASPITQTTTTSRVGTYGQYSLGLAGQVVNTGWLGFVRVDYRDGANISGWTGNAGLRYQFTPETIAAVFPAKAKALPRPLVGATNWTGFYVGGFFGAGAGRTDIGFVGAPADGARPWVFGPLGGLQAGYNYHMPNNWVLGVEGDIAAANIHGGRTAGVNNGFVATANGAASVGFSPALYTVQDKTNWVGTVTGRAGYAWNRTLLYVKGGVAIEDSSTTANCIYGPTGVIVPPAPSNPKACLNQAGANVASFSTPSYTRVGWTLGFGTEFDLGRNWSAKGEYNYLSFGNHTALASDGTSLLTDKSYVSQVKVGLNYRFNSAAVVAKY